MRARKLIDNVKKELNIEHDKELAELAGIKIGTLTQAIARNSFQFETLIPFLISRGVDLNRIFESEGIVQNVTNSSGFAMINNGEISNTMETPKQKDDEYPEIFEECKEKYNFYKKNGGNLITDQFEADIRALFEKHDRTVKILKEALPK